QNSPAYLLIPYTVVGSITVCCGQFFFGEVGPNTAIDDGQYTLANFSSLAISNTLSRLCIFRLQARCGFFSPVADKMAANKYTWVIFWRITCTCSISLFMASR